MDRHCSDASRMGRFTRLVDRETLEALLFECAGLRAYITETSEFGEFSERVMVGVHCKIRWAKNLGNPAVHQ